MIAEAVSALCASFGLDADRLPKKDHVALDIEDFGQLHIENRGEELLLYLRRPIDVGADKHSIYSHALEIIHHDRLPPFPVQVAAKDGALVFLARFDEQAVDVSALEQAVETLGELHDRAREVPNVTRTSGPGEGRVLWTTS